MNKLNDSQIAVMRIFGGIFAVISFFYGTNNESVFFALILPLGIIGALIMQAKGN